MMICYHLFACKTKIVMNSGKEKLVINKNVTASNLSTNTSQSKESSRNLNVNLGQNLKQSKVNIWLDDDRENNTGITVNRSLNTRHNTCPQILPTFSINNDSGNNDDDSFPTPRAGPSLSLPNNVARKSFFGELKNMLTFAKKKDATDDTQQETDEDQTLGKVVVEKEVDKENRKVALQNRRKQIFQSQDEDKEANTDFSGLSSKVNTIQMSIKKWKIKKFTQVERDTIAVNTHHQKLLDDCHEQLQTEIPFPLHNIVKEEALRVSIKVHQMYKSMLGNKHKFTVEAEQHIKFLKQSLYGEENS